VSFEVTRTPAGFLGVDPQEAPTGALLGEVFADGPAHRAGLAAGDVITAIGGVPVTAANIRRVLEGLGAGATAPCAITRGVDHLVIDVTLGARP
jgi:S1-C subfamily serine protease